jgi:CTP synthase
VNNAYRGPLSEAGMTISATSPDGDLVEMIELENHPWFLATQFHPELKSRPNHPHPIFASFIEAAVARRTASAGRAEPSVAEYAG